MELNSIWKAKIIFAGGSDELHFAMTAMFDAMTALSSKYNALRRKLLDLMTKQEMVL